jgi:hypothetical protein
MNNNSGVRLFVAILSVVSVQSSRCSEYFAFWCSVLFWYSRTILFVTVSSFTGQASIRIVTFKPTVLLRAYSLQFLIMSRSQALLFSQLMVQFTRLMPNGFTMILAISPVPSSGKGWLARLMMIV